MSRRSHVPKVVVAVAAGALVAGTPLPAQAYSREELHKVVGGLPGPRGVATLGNGRILVATSTGRVLLARERLHRRATVRALTRTTPGFAGAIDNGPRGTVYILTGGGGPGLSRGASTLFKWRPSYKRPRVVADIARYQLHDPDPFNVADDPRESNPFGVAALRDGTVLVADAAGNDLLRVWPNGHIKTVAVLKPRRVTVPPGLPGAGTRVRSEDVATSVTVGADGFWYVGELRGYPATRRTSQVWRIRPGTVHAVCDPTHPRRGHCKRYVDGLTSIVDLAADRRGNIYALSLSKKSWLAVESPTPVPGARIGGLFRISPHGRRIHELVRNRLVLPGGVDVNPRGRLYVTGPVLGRGALRKIVP